MSSLNKNSLITWKLLLNKYVMSFVIFIVWISFMDQHNLITQYKLSSALSEMDDKKEHYIDQIKTTQDKREHIENDREKFARERYFMKRDNEEVFIIEKPKKLKNK